MTSGQEIARGRDELFETRKKQQMDDLRDQVRCFLQSEKTSSSFAHGDKVVYCNGELLLHLKPGTSEWYMPDFEIYNRAVEILQARPDLAWRSVLIQKVSSPQKRTADRNDQLLRKRAVEMMQASDALIWTECIPEDMDDTDTDRPPITNPGDRASYDTLLYDFHRWMLSAEGREWATSNWARWCIVMGGESFPPTRTFETKQEYRDAFNAIRTHDSKKVMTVVQIGVPQFLTIA